MSPGFDSLNVAAASAIALHHFSQRLQAGRPASARRFGLLQGPHAVGEAGGSPLVTVRPSCRGIASALAIGESGPSSFAVRWTTSAASSFICSRSSASAARHSPDFAVSAWRRDPPSAACSRAPAPSAAPRAARDRRRAWRSPCPDHRAAWPIICRSSCLPTSRKAGPPSSAFAFSRSRASSFSRRSSFSSRSASVASSRSTFLSQFGGPFLLRLQGVARRLAFGGDLLMAPVRPPCAGRAARRCRWPASPIRIRAPPARSAGCWRKSWHRHTCAPSFSSSSAALLQRALGLRRAGPTSCCSSLFALAAVDAQLAGLASSSASASFLSVRSTASAFSSSRPRPISTSLFGRLLAQRLDVHLEPARRHRELGAHAVLVGLDFGRRQRHRGLDALARQRDGPPPDGRRRPSAPESRHRESRGQRTGSTEPRRTTRCGGGPPKPDLPRRMEESSCWHGRECRTSRHRCKAACQQPRQCKRHAAHFKNGTGASKLHAHGRRSTECERRATPSERIPGRLAAVSLR